MKIAQYKLKTVIGDLYLAASEKGLREVLWRPRSHPVLKTLGNDSISQHLSQAVRELTEYLAGKRTKFEVTLDVDGTEFQKQVWAELAKIPYGKTLSYRDVAKRIRNPKAVRAVGTANGRNPVSIIVPCHRVIAASGGLGGYAGGLPTKTRLLQLEGLLKD